MSQPEPRRSSLELIAPNFKPSSGERIEEVPLSSIVPNAKQVRTIFNEEAIRHLAESIATHGLLAPLVVRRIAPSPVTGLAATPAEFELIAGERRWRALKLLSREKAQVIIRVVSDKDMRLLALVENIHREDLGLLEKAASILALKEELGNIEAVATAVKKSRSYTFTLARIGELETEFKDVIERNKLSMDDADRLASLVKDVHKKGDTKIEIAIRRAFQSGPVDMRTIDAIRLRFLPQDREKGSRRGRLESRKAYWTSRKEIGLIFKFRKGQPLSNDEKKTVVEQSHLFLKALGARKVDIHF